MRAPVVCFACLLWAQSVVAFLQAPHRDHVRAAAVACRQSRGDDQDTEEPVAKTYMPPEVARRRGVKLTEAQESKRRSSTDLAIDDFIGKRYGRGSQFYGQRLSDLAQQDLADMADSASEVEQDLAKAEMKPTEKSALSLHLHMAPILPVLLWQAWKW